MLSRNANVFYATGTRFVFVYREGRNVLSPQTTAIVTPDAEVYCQRLGPFDIESVALDTTWSPSIELYTDEPELVGILGEYGVGRARGSAWSGPGLCVGINPLKFETIRRRILQGARRRDGGFDQDHDNIAVPVAIGIDGRKRYRSWTLLPGVGHTHFVPLGRRTPGTSNPRLWEPRLSSSADSWRHLRRPVLKQPPIYRLISHVV